MESVEELTRRNVERIQALEQATQPEALSRQIDQATDDDGPGAGGSAPGSS
jgi:hypothetical protein